MSVAIECSCGKKFKAKESQRGKTFACPSCAAPIYVDASIPQGTLPPTPTHVNPASEDINLSVEPGQSQVARLSSRRSSNRTPMMLALVALLISLASGVWVLYQVPTGSRISKYDFSSPEKSLHSQMEMQETGDFLAAVEISYLQVREKMQEKKSTLKVHKETTSEGRIFLFISYQEEGELTHNVVPFEKNESTGHWFPSKLLGFSHTEQELQNEILEWKHKPAFRKE